MFSEKLEELVSASLVDGAISPKERAVLKRMAAAEGIDGDTMDVLLDARIQEMAQEKKMRQRRCPNCGATLEAFSTHCPACHTEVTSERTASSIDQLNQKLASLANSYLDEEEGRRVRRDIISTFPVPNNREDLLEFLSLSAANSQIKGGLTATPMRRFFLGIGIGWIVFFIMYGMGSQSEDNSMHKYGILEIISISLFSSFLIGGWFALRYAKKGGNKADREHNEMAATWKAKFDQVMTKARLTLRSADDINTLNALQKQVHGR